VSVASLIRRQSSGSFRVIAATLLMEKQMPDPASTWSNIAVIVNMAIGVCVGLFADKINGLLFRPRLDVRFGNGVDLRGVTSGPHGKYLYLRGAIQNKSRFAAENVKAYLVRIDKIEPNDRLARIDYTDALQLRWSAVAEDQRAAGREIPSDIVFCFDVLATNERCPTELALSTVFLPTRYRQLFSLPGQYKLSISITADAQRATRHYVTIEWGGHWDRLRVI